jgi:trimeric autotransporter adhesin
METARRSLCVAGLIALFYARPGWPQGFTISTVAGGGLSSGPFPVPATSVLIDDPTGLAVDSSGNIYLGGGVDNVVYKISGGIMSIVAGKPSATGGYSGDGGPATSALLNDPQGVAVDSASNLYVVDYMNYVVREVSGGIIKTIAGNGSYGTPVAGPATATPLLQPIGVAVDASDNVYISVGIAGGYIVKVANGTLSIFAGVGYEGTVTSGASATTQPVIAPHYITVDPSGNVIIPTGSGGQVLKVTVSNDTISVLAGSGTFGTPLGDGGPATSAGMTPFGAGVDSSGNLYIADTANYRVREVVNGTINTIAGNGNLGACSNTYSGPATGVGFDNPAALAVVSSTIYFADANCVYKLTGASATGLLRSIGRRGQREPVRRIPSGRARLLC